MSAERVGQILSALADDGDEGAPLPERLCAAGARALPVSGVGMALMTGEGHQGGVAASDGLAATLEEIQFTLGEGPCMDASRDGCPVLVPDLARDADRRWPGFGSEVRAAGVAAVFAFPLQVGGIRLGVLDLYRDTVGVLDDAELEEALAFADAATTVLLELQDRMLPGGGLHPELSGPGWGGPEIHQATGMIAVQALVGLSEALLLMRAHAFATSRAVQDVARDVLARRLRFEPEDEQA